MRYRVVVERAAARALQRLNRQPVGVRLVAAIEALRDEPRPPGCKKLSIRDSWRIRVGDYRIIYEIADEVRIVTVQRVRKRDEAYDE